MRNTSRTKLLVLVHLLILTLLPTTPPSSSMGPDFQTALNAEEIALYADLAGWIGNGKGAQALKSAAAPPIREAIRSPGFDLFRLYHGEDACNTHLARLPYGEAIRSSAKRYGVDGLLIASIVEAESGFDPHAVSSRGAVGLMQVMPATADLGAHDELVDPRLNLDRGVRYLRQLLEIYDGDLELTLAAYNAGPANVRRYGGLPPFTETRRYVDKVLELYVDHYRAVWRDSEVGKFLISG